MLVFALFSVSFFKNIYIYIHFFKWRHVFIFSFFSYLRFFFEYFLLTICTNCKHDWIYNLVFFFLLTKSMVLNDGVELPWLEKKKAMHSIHSWFGSHFL